MNSSKKPNRINRKDYCRVLITETLPNETPIIFSNDGLYGRVMGIHSADYVQKELITNLVFGQSSSLKNNAHSCIPALYKIRKNSKEFRQLALLHPLAQWKIKEFYERYEHLILYHCSHSKASIRAPQKVAGSFFFNNSRAKLNQYKYKDGSVSLMRLDELTKHSPSFFSYRGFDRLYKFFESQDYFELEKKYGYMQTLDVSKCFDSIYTHTMSWAIKDKAFTKKYVGVSATFGQQFDELMQFANHNETNGIVIGPEISRLFAEIIFQDIDIKVISRLENGKPTSLEFGDQYCFRRYVDDVVIFAKNAEIAQRVYACYADTLVPFKLHANAAKSVGIARPFVTNKSRLIHTASYEVNSFVGKFLEETENRDVLVPKDIHSVWRLTRSFIESIRSLCSHNQVNYDEVSTYLIAVLTERVKNLVAVRKVDASDEVQKRYGDSIRTLLDVLYFLYQVSPSVGASYKLCTSIVLLIRFTKKHMVALEHSVAHRIYELTEALLMSQKQSAPAEIDGFLHLEVLNVMLAIRELGDDYLLPESMVKLLFDEDAEHSYFSIVSCLFYIKDNPTFVSLKAFVLGVVQSKLSDLSDIRMNSEKMHLLFDLFSCPYIPDKMKREWIKRVFEAMQISEPSKAEKDLFLQNVKCTYWHINWNDNVDLLNSLEKKELKQAY